MPRIGAIEQEKLQAVAMLQAGRTLDDVIAVFSNVERDYWEANAAELYELAGLKTSKVEKPKK